ncbi:peptidase, M23/M37 family protein [Roseobacter sp. SK209-2-6]|uniref:M23 family metallopeptidase n=1 Tax=Roseobacter sp. SK209-2-6 TaxID=388739 RepID=UPI0000F3D4F4|nr:M23 family metallopeptidase [Roseobacter sp. SK209-2-6]EBA15788.1 peptidase, M23/M37 family protein [Roseobacter sp. SK209-2-6]
MRRALIAALFSLASVEAKASDVILHWPLDCRLGEDCHIQHYVDRAPGDQAQDYRCSSLTYDNHQGTDIALPSLQAMHEGVSVLAAAPGVVRAIRDSMSDGYASAKTAESLRGRECGNGVVVRHSGGWETQYCHMKRGSIQVEPGQNVTVGTVLGQVGLSGRTEFPHLHLSIRRDGRIVDPFAPDEPQGCHRRWGGRSLWADPPAYQAGGFMSSGFNSAIPEFPDVKSGDAAIDTLGAEPEAMVFWAYAFGGQKRDRIRLSISGPEGIFWVHETILDKNQIQFFRAVGKALKQRRLPKGAYEGLAILFRGDREIDRISHTIQYP